MFDLNPILGKQMSNSRIYLSQTHLSGLENSYIEKAFSSNLIAGSGENNTELENSLENYLNSNSNVAVLNSGTAAIHLGLILLNVKRDDVVICQSMTFSASANPILYLGATPVFVDSELETWNMCPVFLEKAINDQISKGKKPKAIIAVHLYGMPYKVDEINAIANKYKIPILEDSAEALGSAYKGQKCGTFGNIGIFSFNGNKIITTSGGGALVSNDISIKNKAIFLATQARDNAPHYQHSELGYNYVMNNISAGIGCAQLKQLENRIESRRNMHQFYIDVFKNSNGVEIFCEPNSNYFSNYWLTALLIDSEKTMGKTREDLRLFLEKSNIESRPLWKPMHLQPIFESYPYYGNKISENLFKNGLCLPSSSNLKTEEKNRIKEQIQLFFQ